MKILVFFRKVRAIGLRRTLRGDNILKPITQQQLKQGIRLVWNSKKGLWE